MATDRLDEREITLGFLDVLGFKAAISDWEKARDYHQRVVATFSAYRRWVQDSLALASEASRGASVRPGPDFRARILSDSFIFTTNDPEFAIRTAASFQNTLSDFGLFCRGCIATGRHIEEGTLDGDFIVVSEALSWAAEGEARQAIHPRIYLHESTIKRLEEVLVGQPFLSRRFSSLLIQSDDSLWSLDPGFGIPRIDLLEEAVRSELKALHPRKVHAKYEWLAEQIDFIKIWDQSDSYNSAAYYEGRDLSSVVQQYVELGASPLASQPATPRAKFFRFPRPGPMEVVRYSLGDSPLTRPFGENVQRFALRR
jgi:hypothetical protein